MSLEEYDHKIGHHLRMIRHHAMAMVVHAEMMARRPEFETLAEDELEKCDAVLALALGKVRYSLQTVREKPIDA